MAFSCLVAEGDDGGANEIGGDGQFDDGGADRPVRFITGDEASRAGDA